MSDNSRTNQRIPDRLSKRLLFLLLSAWAVVLAAPSASACPDIDGLADLNCNGQVEVVLFGDSITYGIGDSTKLGYPGRLAQLMPNIVIRNLGKPGEKTPNGRARASTRFAQFPFADYAIVLEGVNDYFLDERTVSSTRSNVLAMLRSANNTGAVGMLATLTDIRRDYQRPWVLAVNSAIKPNTTVDFFALGRGIIGSDKLHPTGSGYQLMAEYVANVLRAMSASHRPADVDGDGIYDFAEARFNTDPTIADTDGDGVNDGAEIFVYRSNPRAVDSDNDGFSDGFEVQLGSDPASPRPVAPVLNDLRAIEPPAL